jgi:hypothetical protein
LGKPKENRVPKLREAPANREVRVGGSPESAQQTSDTKTPAWQFSRIDERHADWGWKNLTPAQWRDVLTHLKSFEGLTWAGIQAQAGGRKHGNNSHPLDVSDLTASAQNRLAEIGLEEVDKVFSLRLTNTLRVYGIREDRTLRILWRDPHHGTKRGCCPTKNSN